jgi:hypothetical protein
VEVAYEQTRVLDDFVGESGQRPEGGYLFFDYKGKQVRSITVNGQAVSFETPHVFVGHKIYIPKALQKVG